MKLEILAPGGGFDSVVAAVRSGADAVYLGAKSFSARAGAENFDSEELKEITGYCHIRGVKVYLTLNTVVFDSELGDVKELILSAAAADVDAILVQSVGIAGLVRSLVPDMPLHASTQMSVHSPSGAKLLWEMGFKRAVLARELSREEIIEIRNASPIELEVFVHGALCMSVSGQCYFSSVIGSRSGNRGRCAQTCRLPFSVNGKKGYAPSLKDNSIIERIRELEDIGVCSAKIEGRLKRPEYVAAAVQACVQARDKGYLDREISERLESVFSRTGFTDGYYTGKRGYEMFGYRQKEDVVSATSKLFSEIRQSYKDELQRVPVKIRFTANHGKAPKIILTGEDESVTVSANGVVCEKAVNIPLDAETARRQLTKTGGTPFYVTECNISIEDDVSLSLSVLNALRREALAVYSEKRRIVNKYKIKNKDIEKPEPHIAEEKKTYARFCTAKIGAGFRELDLCFVPLNSGADEIDRLIDGGFTVGVEIPRALFSREEKIISELTLLKEHGVTDVLCNNIGAVYIAKNLGFRIHGGFGLNFTNTLDLLWAEKYGVEDTELSFELSIPQIEKLGGNIARGIISYGYLPVMLTRNCPNKSVRIRCRECGGRGKMQDRLGKTFIFYCDGYATEILNTLPVEEISAAGKSRNLDFQVFRFSVENSVENVENKDEFIRQCLNSEKKTHGLYRRGII